MVIRGLFKPQEEAKHLHTLGARSQPVNDRATWWTQPLSATLEFKVGEIMIPLSWGAPPVAPAEIQALEALATREVIAVVALPGIATVRSATNVILLFDKIITGNWRELTAFCAWHTSAYIATREVL